MPQTKPMSWISTIILMTITITTLKTLTQATEFTQPTLIKKLSTTKKMKW